MTTLALNKAIADVMVAKVIDINTQLREDTGMSTQEFSILLAEREDLKAELREVKARF